MKVPSSLPAARISHWTGLRRRLAERIVTIFSLNRIDALTYLRQRDILIDTKLAKLINDAEDPDAIIVVQFVNARKLERRSSSLICTESVLSVLLDRHFALFREVLVRTLKR